MGGLDFSRASHGSHRLVGHAQSFRETEMAGEGQNKNITTCQAAGMLPTHSLSWYKHVGSTSGRPHTSKLTFRFSLLAVYITSSTGTMANKCHGRPHGVFNGSTLIPAISCIVVHFGFRSDSTGGWKMYERYRFSHESRGPL